MLSTAILDRYKKFFVPLNAALDLLIFNATFIGFIAYEKLLSCNDFFLFHWKAWLIFNFTWICSISWLKIYKIEPSTKSTHLLASTLKQLLVFTLVLFAVSGYKEEKLLSPIGTMALIILIAILALINKFVAHRLIQNADLNVRKKVAIVGINDTAVKFKRLLESTHAQNHISISFFSPTTEESELKNLLEGGVWRRSDYKGDLNSLKQLCLEKQIDEIFCTLSIISNDRLNELIDFAENQVIVIKFIPDQTLLQQSFKLTYYSHFPILQLRELPLSDPVNQAFKRALDFSIALVVVLFVLPWLYLIIGFLIKLESKGPILFKQARSGLNNKPFFCYKFRSMVVNTHENALQSTSKSDARVTKVGQFIRKTSLDEFPQFINVLKGEMSIVGPRPHHLVHTQFYKGEVSHFMARHFAKPGITGLAQVRGYRGEITSALFMKNRIRMDLFYIENWSILLDLKIILRTICLALKRDQRAY